MYFELRDNEFRFVAQKGDRKDCVFYEMDYDSAIIRLRNRLQRANENEKKKKTKIEEVNVLETGPGPVIEGRAPPADNHIVCRKRDAPKGHRGNAEYRNRIVKASSAFKVASRKERQNIRCIIVDDLRELGFRFVNFEEGTWMEVNQDQIMKKVRKNLTDSARDFKASKIITKKRKAVDMENAFENKKESSNELQEAASSEHEEEEQERGAAGDEHEEEEQESDSD